MGKLVLAAFSMALMLSNPCVGQEAIVLDGLGGLGGRFMRPEANRLKNQGYQVTYRPWFRWRSAVRQAPHASHVIAFSMGCPRAIQVARMTNAKRLELVDPVSPGEMFTPPGIQTVVYRATGESRIRSTPVYGTYRQYLIPTNHIGMPSRFRFGN